jgi:hypothetical protein
MEITPGRYAVGWKSQKAYCFRIEIGDSISKVANTCGLGDNLISPAVSEGNSEALRASTTKTSDPQQEGALNIHRRFFFW